MLEAASTSKASVNLYQDYTAQQHRRQPSKWLSSVANRGFQSRPWPFPWKRKLLRNWEAEFVTSSDTRFEIQQWGLTAQCVLQSIAWTFEKF
jgi:hypothetical protein